MTHSEPTSSQMADVSAAESLPATFIPEGPADFFDELQALAANALGALTGELPVKTYTQKETKPCSCLEPQLP